MLPFCGLLLGNSDTSMQLSWYYFICFSGLVELISSKFLWVTPADKMDSLMSQMLHWTFPDCTKSKTLKAFKVLWIHFWSKVSQGEMNRIYYKVISTENISQNSHFYLWRIEKCWNFQHFPLVVFIILKLRLQIYYYLIWIDLNLNQE